jgi:enoyl-[acyl-carrier protein] reductase II
MPWPPAVFDSRLPVIPVRALKNEGTIEFGKLQMELRASSMKIASPGRRPSSKWSASVGALRRAAVDGDVVKWILMAGHRWDW